MRMGARSQGGQGGVTSAVRGGTQVGSEIGSRGSEAGPARACVQAGGFWGGEAGTSVPYRLKTACPRVFDAPLATAKPMGIAVRRHLERSIVNAQHAWP